MQYVQKGPDFMSGPSKLYPFDFSYTPLYFNLVARPPRMCRSALLKSMTSLTCRYRGLLICSSRSDRSLCTVDLLIPNFFAAERTVALLSIM